MPLILNIVYSDKTDEHVKALACNIGEYVVDEYKKTYSWSEYMSNRAYFIGDTNKSIAAVFFPHLSFVDSIVNNARSTLDSIGATLSSDMYADGFSNEPYLSIPNDVMTTFVSEPYVISQLDPCLNVHSQLRVTYDLCIKIYNIYSSSALVKTDKFTQEALDKMISDAFDIAYITTMLDACSSIRETGVVMSSTHLQLVYGVLADCAYQVFSYDDIRAKYNTTDEFCEYFCNTGRQASVMEAESLLNMYNREIYSGYKSAYIASLVKHMYTQGAIDLYYVSRLCASVLRLMYLTEYRDSTMGNRLYIFTPSGWEVCEGKYKMHASLANITVALNMYMNDSVIHSIGMTRSEYDSFKLDVHRFVSSKYNLSSLSSTLLTQLVVPEYSKRSYTYCKCIMFTNGTYDLERDVFRNTYPHDIGCYNTRYMYYTLGNSTVLEEQLDTFMSALFPRDDVKEYVYRIFSRCFEGANVEKGIWFFIGSTNAGKSKFMDLVATAFGNYSVRLPAKMFNDTSRGSGQATTSLNQTIGKLVGVIQEPPRTNYNVETIKEYTGETVLNARMMYKEGDQIRNSVRYFCCANATNISTSDAAFWRRLSVVPFDVQFLPMNEYLAKTNEIRVRYSYTGYLKTFDTLEKELQLYAVEDSEIASKISVLAPVLMSVLIRYYTDPSKRECNIDKFEPILTATARFRLANDHVFRFIRYRTTIARTPEEMSTMKEPLSVVYDMFAMWYDSSTHGRRVQMNTEEFSSALGGMGFNITGDGSDQMVEGITLRGETMSGYTKVNTAYTAVGGVTIDQQQAALLQSEY